MKRLLFCTLLIVLPISSSLCIDMYLPAYGYIASSFHIKESAMDISMSVYLFGLAFGQLIYGPFADRFGRKKALLPGIVIFTAGSLLCAISNVMWLFLLARLIQAFGACASIVLCRTIVADSFHPEKRTQMLALISATNIFSPALAPLIGGYITAFYEWRVIFFSIAVFGALMFVASIILIRETLTSPNVNALRWSVQLANAKRLFKDHMFTGFVICLSFLYVTVFVWVTLSPSLMIDHFGIKPDKFGLYFLLPAIGSCLGALTTAKLSQYFNSYKCIRFGVCWLMLTATLFILIHHYINAPQWYVFFVMLLFFGTGFTSPQLISDAIGRFVDIGGYTSGVIGFMQTSFGGLMGFVASYFYANSARSISVLMLVTICCALLAFLYAIFKERNSQLVKVDPN